VTATGQESREPRVGGPTIAAWRRRQDACSLDPSAPDAEHVNGYQATANTASTDSPDQIGRDFAASQQAGINAMISLAAPDHSSRPAPAVNRRASSSRPPASSSGGTSHSQPVPIAALTTPVMDRPRAGPSLPVAPGYSPAAQAQVKPKPKAVRHSYGLANFRPPLLIAILTIQAVLSLRLVWSNTAYIDEATYLWAGHLEIAHWLNGTPVPQFQTWLSGAPAIYPPVAAVADTAGGLFGARILSLALMTGATALLWNVTSRLFGSLAAFFATLLFATLGPTQFLGALATYDAMALLLMAVSAWCVVAARDHADSTVLLVAGAVLLALANATKYATALFDPVVFALAALVIAQKRGAKPALGRAGYVAASVVALVAGLVALGGPLYMAGIMYTTLARAAGDNSPMLVCEDAWKWAGVVCILAWIGVILCLLRGNRGQAMLLALLAAAGLLAPLEQARIHTITSLHKHVDFGAWLAAPAAGYALAWLSRISKRRGLHFLAAGLIACAAIPPIAVVGSAQARSLFSGWPNSSSIIAKLRALTRSYPGNYLAEDYDIPAYYLRNSVPAQRWSNTWYFSYTPAGSQRPLTGVSAYRAAIARHYFSLIILDFGATPRTDSQIATELHQAGGYHILGVVRSSFSQYTIWAYRPHLPPGQQSGLR
jgi:Dolichyl-phosphate-mannose-protein mannosyltransferase